MLLFVWLLFGCVVGVVVVDDGCVVVVGIADIVSCVTVVV